MSVHTLKILEAITPSGIGGAEIYVTSLCRFADSHALEVRLFCPAGRQLREYAASRGVNCAGWRTLGKLDPLTVIRLVRLIRQGRFDVIHTHLSTASLLGALAARLAGVPSVAHVHGMNTATCYTLSSHIIAVSEAVRQNLCRQGIEEKSVSVVHSGVDTEQFQPIPAEEAKRALGLDPNAPTVGVFGRLSEEKGQRVAVEAFFLLKKEFPEAKLVVAGDGPDRESLSVTAEALGIEDAVLFTGFLQDVRVWMSACDVVAVPSLREGLCLAAIEAMALGRPVVASDTGGLREVILEGTTGRLIEPNNPAELAEKLAELLREGDLRSRMGCEGRRRAVDHFDQTNQFKQVLQVLAGTVEIYRARAGNTVFPAGNREARDENRNS